MHLLWCGCFAVLFKYSFYVLRVGVVQEIHVPILPSPTLRRLVRSPKDVSRRTQVLPLDGVLPEISYFMKMRAVFQGSIHLRECLNILTWQYAGAASLTNGFEEDQRGCCGHVEAVSLAIHRDASLDGGFVVEPLLREPQLFGAHNYGRSPRQVQVGVYGFGVRRGGDDLNGVLPASFHKRG